MGHDAEARNKLSGLCVPQHHLATTSFRDARYINRDTGSLGKAEVKAFLLGGSSRYSSSRQSLFPQHRAQAMTGENSCLEPALQPCRLAAVI